jgi:hypothetical protein
VKISHAILSAAVSGMTLGLLPATASAAPAETLAGTLLAAGFDSPAGLQLDADAGAKHACKGQNACKGQGGCKTDKNSCKGQNACKAQGGCRTDGK